jgi:hypothetical protein
MLARIAALARRNALGLIAIFIAASGTAYAAASLPHNSVGTKQLKNGAVTSGKVASQAVTGSKVKNGSLTGSKVKNGSLTGSKVKNGSLTGTQINASTLGLVANATHATTAGSATTANVAANASRLQGKAAADFTPADKVLTSGWKTASTCGNACATNVTFFDNGTFDLRAGCQGNGSGPGAFTFLFTDASGTTQPWFEGVSGAENPAGAQDTFATGPEGNTTPTVSQTNFDFVSSAGTPMEGTVTSIANTPSAGHCAFDATAISG